VSEPFIPRVFRSDKGSVVVEEPGGQDYGIVARAGEDLLSVFPHMRAGETYTLPIGALFDRSQPWKFRQLEPRIGDL
jgi:hypothetical protein